MNKDLTAIFEYLEREKGIKRDVIIQAIEESLQAAAQKSVTGAANATVHIDPKTAKIEVFCEKEIVEEVTNPSTEIQLDDARELDPQCQLGQFIDVLVTPKDFGRIAAQKARQVIMQKLRSAERDVIYEEYRHKVGEVVSGTVKRFIRGAKVIVDLGKVDAVLPLKNYPKNEHYHPGDSVYALLLEVRDTEVGSAEVVLTRSHPEYVLKLFEQEVPEVKDGTIIIDKIVREAGYRTKITVRATDPKVDPVGACVGMRGLRVKNVVRELNNEKIDIIPFSEDPIELLQEAIKPVEIRKIRVIEEDRAMSIVVDDENFAVVFGKHGLNAKLNGELIGYELEIQAMSDYNKAMAVHRFELSNSKDPTLNEPIKKIEGINKLLTDLVIEKYPTPGKLLQATPEELSAIPEITREMAEMILEHMYKQIQSHQEKENAGVEAEQE